jgi:hypothetical protein
MQYLQDITSELSNKIISHSDLILLLYQLDLFLKNLNPDISEQLNQIRIDKSIL